MPRKKKVIKKAVQIVEPLKPSYQATLKVGGKLFNAQGESVGEAIGNLKPTIKRGIGILTLTKGDKRREKILQLQSVSQAFGNTSRLIKEISLKRVSLMFDL